ncbi:MAG: HAD superfamily hydrolase (TIGR01509 family) [Granulosicoccus sp.]|jgi:HAD superfamily hydrolase (TIGR01509 family)
MKITACIFDMDGLLIDSERIALRVFQEICGHFQCNEQLHLFNQLLGTNAKTTRQVLSDALPPSVKVDEFIDLWSVNYAIQTEKPIALKKGILELLDYLESAGIPKAVATSTQTTMAIEKLDKSGIANRFSYIIGGDQVTLGKPAPEIYIKAANALNMGATHCLALEDSPNGVKAAVAANMQVIQIPDTVQPDDTLRSMGHNILEHALEVVTFLQSNTSRS